MVHRLKVRVRAAEEDSENKCVECALIDKLTAKPLSFTAETEQAKEEHVSLVARICELEITAATCFGELRDVAPHVES